MESLNYNGEKLLVLTTHDLQQDSIGKKLHDVTFNDFKPEARDAIKTADLVIYDCSRTMILKSRKELLVKARVATLIG